MQGRGQSPCDKHLVAQWQMPRLMTADQDLTKPIIQMEKEEATPKTTVISEICTVDIFPS